MSMTSGENSFNVSTEPPPFVSGGGGYSITPGTKLPARRVDPSAQVSPDVAFTAEEEADFTPEGYVGLKLVNGQGVIARNQYNDDEAYTELAKMEPTARRNFLNTLYSFGVYGGSRPSSTGFSSQDFSAVREAMLYANAKGVTLDAALTILATEAQPVRGSGARIRTTPKEDLRAVFRQVSSQTLGRRLPDAEIERFVKAYNRAEVTEARGGEAAPSVEVAAMQQIEATNSDEATAMGALKLAEIMDQKIKGLA